MTTARKQARVAACNHVPAHDVAGCADAVSDVWEPIVRDLAAALESENHDWTDGRGISAESRMTLIEVYRLLGVDQ